MKNPGEKFLLKQDLNRRPPEQQAELVIVTPYRSPKHLGLLCYTVPRRFELVEKKIENTFKDNIFGPRGYVFHSGYFIRSSVKIMILAKFIFFC